MKDMWGLAVRGICEVDGEILLLKVRSKSSHDAGKWEILQDKRRGKVNPTYYERYRRFKRGNNQ